MTDWSDDGVHWPAQPVTQQPRRISLADLWQALQMATARSGILADDLQAMVDQAAQVNAALAVSVEQAERLAADLQRERQQRMKLQHMATRAALSPLIPAEAVEQAHKEQASRRTRPAHW